MKPKHFLFFCLSFLIIHSSLLIGTVRYVSKTGSSTPPYTSWQTAADSIQKCINLCVDGDTIYVANGVYYESIYIDKTINLWGSSMDSTVIDGTNANANDIIYFYLNNSSIENFLIKGPGTTKVGMNAWFSNIEVTNCRITQVNSGLIIASSSVLIKNIIITNINTRGIYDICPADTCKSRYLESIISSNDGLNYSMMFFIGGSPTLKNNIIIEEGTSSLGVSFESQRRVVFENNLISGFKQRNVTVLSHSDTVFIRNNNSMNVLEASGFYIGYGNRTVVKNNIIQNTNLGVSGGDVVASDYNLFNNVNTPVNGGAYLGDKNIFADPMFVKDTIPTLNGEYDLHLQKYSPAIDAGDPNILDKDGTRSDIGMYGGPFGETYTYQDLAPLAPRNFSAVLDSEYIRLKWNKNTEADTAFYKVYRDTVTGFVIDSTKLIDSVTDTFFVQSIPHKKSKLVYKITCVDNQGNESLPSVEVVVDLTSVSADDYPMTISDYILYQNYPNPFNPNTRIGYQLKERAYVKLMVYDIKGELVSVLVNKEQNAGYYEADFSVNSPQSSVDNSIASGIYLYRIEVIGKGNIPVYTEMKKMLLIK